MGIDQPRGGDPVAQGRKCDKPVIVVHVQKQEDIGRGMGNDLGNSRDLRVLVAKDVAQQQARALPRKAGMKETDVDRLGSSRTGACQQRQQRSQCQDDQTACKPSAAA